MAPRKKTATTEKPSPLPAGELVEQKTPTAGMDPAEALKGSKIEPDGFLVDKEKHLVIDRAVYDREQFSEEQRGHIAAINYADQRLASMNQDLKTYQMGRDRMVSQLMESIAQLDPVANYVPE